MSANAVICIRRRAAGSSRSPTKRQTLRKNRLEGHALHHCVGGYIDRIADRECLILFLRRCPQPDKSFYTIEIRGQELEKTGVKRFGACSIKKQRVREHTCCLAFTNNLPCGRCTCNIVLSIPKPQPEGDTAYHLLPGCPLTVRAYMVIYPADISGKEKEGAMVPSSYLRFLFYFYVL